MHILKPALVTPVRSYRKASYLFIGACIVFVLGDMNGFFRGMHVGAASKQQVQPETASSVECGITDPLACMALIADRIGEALLPEPEMIVTIIEGETIVCAEMEENFRECAEDATCPFDTLATRAEYVQMCRSASAP